MVQGIFQFLPIFWEKKIFRKKSLQKIHFFMEFWLKSWIKPVLGQKSKIPWTKVFKIHSKRFPENLKGLSQKMIEFYSFEYWKLFDFDILRKWHLKLKMTFILKFFTEIYLILCYNYFSMARWLGYYVKMVLQCIFSV